MFTGIIQHCGRIASIEANEFGCRVMIDLGTWSHQPSPGDSIAVDGCCLTVAAFDAESAFARFDVIAQTLSVTTLQSFAAGRPVNLEHAVTPTTMLGGHIVQGHVDGVGRVRTIAASSAEHRLRIAPPDSDAMKLIVDKGSIAVNGVSLTVAATGADWFEVALIPTTLELTNLGSLLEGDRVNLEYDYLAKVVANWMSRQRPG